ncbi:hypothetical protein BOO86_22710 [Mycobacterium sp. CBMA 234]|uniref:DUF6670 family protein n=1 Tax=Mycolicibacterium sp. CBMA 234 TaxID=1918495 RepID=UPI0012DDAA4A|nr:DUF6670 family protein [Mycolicibacterium sp. CBMA 234]MUL67303.1 hypothetical protein [Mycolicibacterium sp. CBMA 234]
MKKHVISRALSRAVIDGMLPLVDSRLTASRQPFDAPQIIQPHDTSRAWGVAHFGVFVPDLPEPYRYLNTMTLLGASGTELFDLDHLAATDARDTSTVFSSTAHADQRFYRAYDMHTDCSFTSDARRLRWAEDLAINVALPHVVVRGRYPQFDVDLKLEVTDQVSYFVKTPIYDHLSLLAPYSGTVDDVEVSGLGTFEYARIRTHQALTRRPMPAQLKLPLDFFTYQIINLDERTQVLLTDVRARGRTACRLAHVRVLGRETEVYDDVHFAVTEYGEPLVDDRGNPMRRPRKIKWSVRDGGREVLTLIGALDAPWRLGHGPGYATAYSYTGTWRSEPVSGSAYLEWVDVQPR